MKRRLIVLAVFFASLVVVVGVPKPKSAKALRVCPTATGNVSGSATFNNISPGNSITTTGTGYVTITTNLGTATVVLPVSTSASSSVTFVTFSFSTNGAWSVAFCGATLVGGGGSSTTSNAPTCPIFLDGRLNNCVPWQTSAIYCQLNGSVRVYVIGNPNWTIDFDATPGEIAAVPKKPAHNMLIKQGHFANLSRLTNGLLQVTAPGLNPRDGDYVFIFQDCPAVQK